MERPLEFRNDCPKIANCRGGADCKSLTGNLSESEVEEVKRLPISSDIRDQESFYKSTVCIENGGKQTVIGYFPWKPEKKGIFFKVRVSAFCLSENCKNKMY